MLLCRLQEFVRQSRPLLNAEASSGSDTEGDAAMVTPPSHLDSGQTTPTFGDAAELQQRGPRQPFGGADAAGGAAGRDGLAPPEVRQRVLSDAAAAQLLREGQQRKDGTNNAGTTGEAAPAEAGQDDQMMRLYNAARHATMQLHHGAGSGAGGQPGAGQSVAHHRQNSSLVSADLSDAESLLGALADTPATPSTGVLVCVGHACVGGGAWGERVCKIESPTAAGQHCWQLCPPAPAVAAHLPREKERLHEKKLVACQ